MCNLGTLYWEKIQSLLTRKNPYKRNLDVCSKENAKCHIYQCV